MAETADRLRQPANTVPDLTDHSRRMIEVGSKSFARASKLMPPGIRDSVYMLYAWCRFCDDCVDDQHLGFPSPDPSSSKGLSERVAELRLKTSAACAGSPPDEPVFQALATVVARHDIPERYPLDLIEGFAMDAREHVYATEEDTLLYCYHVAGAVGVMMALVMGVRDRPTLIRACDLGIAFQLTNISRDVIADAEMGRVYIPQSWLAEAGLDETNIAEPDNRKKLFDVTSRLLDAADQFYASAGHGITQLPFRCAWSIAAARRIYRGIGLKIRKRGPAAWDTRTTTSKSEKLGHVAMAASEAGVAAASASIGKTPPRGELWIPPPLRQPAPEAGSNRSLTKAHA